MEGECCERSYRSPSNPDVLWVCTFPWGHDGLCDWIEHLELASPSDEDYAEMERVAMEVLRLPGIPIDFTEGCIRI